MKASNSSSAPPKPAATAASPRRASHALGTSPADLDPRIHAFQPDLADIALAGEVAALHYVRPGQRRIGVPVADLRERPGVDARLGSQLLHGESFALLDIANGWAWGYSMHDHYVGYIRADALGGPAEPTHIVAVSGAQLADAPDSKAEAAGHVPIGYRFTGKEEDRWFALPGGFLPAEAVRKIGEPVEDPIAIAEALIDTPYLWGGRTDCGIDCSGLVQLALAFAGIAAPRDSDQQLAALGVEVSPGELKRGDIIFFPDHVGMMAGAEMLVHATHHWGKVVAEPLEAVIGRIAEEHDRPVLAYRRISA